MFLCRSRLVAFIFSSRHTGWQVSGQHSGQRGNGCSPNRVKKCLLQSIDSSGQCEKVTCPPHCEQWKTFAPLPRCPLTCQRSISKQDLQDFLRSFEVRLAHMAELFLNFPSGLHHTSQRPALGIHIGTGSR